MCNLLKIKYYTVLVMYTFAQPPIIGAKKEKIDPQNFTTLKYFEIKYSFNLLLKAILLVDDNF